jgi:hypothetical protein
MAGGGRFVNFLKRYSKRTYTREEKTRIRKLVNTAELADRELNKIGHKMDSPEYKSLEETVLKAREQLEGLGIDVESWGMDISP